jgi:hypothetical protein
MQRRITAEEMQAAARQLAKSERGRAVMQRLLDWMDEDELKLTLLNQRAFLALLGGAWSGRTEAARRSMRQALSERAAKP